MIPNAVVKRAERAGKAGWDVWISVRVRKNRTSVLMRLARGDERMGGWHYDGKAHHAYRLDECGYARRLIFPEMDALIRSEPG